MLKIEKSLFDLIYEFIAPFFTGEHLTDPSIVQLLTIVLTVLFFYGFFIYPVLWLFGIGRRK